jgi:hypothetical protein
MPKPFYLSDSNLAISFLLLSAAFTAGYQKKEVRSHGIQFLAKHSGTGALSRGDWVSQSDSHGTWSYLRPNGLVCGSVTPDPNEGWWASSGTGTQNGLVSWSNWPTITQAKNAVMEKCR